MKKLLLTLIILLTCVNCFADKLIVPFDCYPKKLQGEFIKHGLKLDLSGNDRTEDSWGFLFSEGANYTIYTYEPITIKELELLRKIILKYKESYIDGN